MARSERAQHSDIAQHKFGLIETADHIFVAIEIDAILAADAGIDLTEQRGRYKSESHTTHKGRSHKTRNIGYDAATDTEQKCLSVGATLNQFAVDLRYGFERFDTFALTDQDVFVLIDQTSIAS